MTKQIPIGISDFKRIIEGNYYYVDKTLLIKDIAESGEVILVTRPRCFGKSLNLSMLRYFYEMSEKPNAHLFENLAIWQHPMHKQEQGKFPVISLSFRTICPSTYEKMLEQFAYTIAQEFDRHAYLLTSPMLNATDKILFMRLQGGKGTEVELTYSLQFLSRVLSEHHQKKVIILIDEYDAPAQAAYRHGHYDPLIHFIKELFANTFENNPVLAKGFLTGVFGICTNLENLNLNTLFDEKMADKYGFTLAESTAMLHDFTIKNLTEIEPWYIGYHFGTANFVANPWSINQCVDKKGDLLLYWNHASEHFLFKKMLTNADSATKKDLRKLITGETLEKTIEEFINLADLDKRPELIWTVMLFTGFVTYKEYSIKADKRVCPLTMPNQEVKYVVKDFIKERPKDSDSNWLQKAFSSSY